MSSNFVTMIYIYIIYIYICVCVGDVCLCVCVYYEHDSKIIPGNRYKDMCRDTLVNICLPGQWKLEKNGI